MKHFEDYYETLQVHHLAEPEVIQGAYRGLAKKYHPDKNKNPDAANDMKRINIAYEILSDPEKRKIYDLEWLQQESKPDRESPMSSSRKHRIDNTSLLKYLIFCKQIRIRNIDYILRDPPAPLPKSFNFKKIEGMLLGLAIGDALGSVTESMNTFQRRAKFGEIRDYLPGSRLTDDTWTSFWTLEQIINDNGFNPENLLLNFRLNLSYKGKDTPWYSNGADSLNNGALMRISPIVVPYLRNPHPSIYADAALNAMITHNSYANTATCVAFVSMLWDLLGMTSAPNPAWWFDRFCFVSKLLEGNTRYQPRTLRNYSGSLSNFTQFLGHEALRRNLSTPEACNFWGSRGNVFETVPSVLYILAKHGDNAEEAIIRAINDTYDNDTIASIVGAAVGALHGSDAIPKRWIEGLKGIVKNKRPDVFLDILQANKVFWNK